MIPWGREKKLREVRTVPRNTRQLGIDVRGRGYNGSMRSIDIATNPPGGTSGPTLLTGLDAHDARRAVLDWRRAQLAAGRDPFVLAPAQGDVTELTLLMCREDGALLGGPGAGTLDDLVTAVLEERGRSFGLLERELAIRQAGEPLWGEAESVFGVLRRPLRGLADVMEELEESGFEDEVIEAGLERWSRLAGHESMRKTAEALRVLWVGYRRVCREWGVESRSRRTVRAAARLAEGVRVGSRWSRPVACYGFATFTPVQRRLLGALAEQAPLLLDLAWEETPTGGFLDPEVAYWTARGAVHVHGPGATRPGDRTPPQLRVLRSSGRRGEVETVAGEVVELLRQGVPLTEIMVVVRRARMWRRLVGDVFHAYGIPLQIEAPLRIADTGLGNAFLMALRGIREGDTAAILSFLRGRYSQERPAALPADARERVHDIELWPDSPDAPGVLAQLFPLTWTRLQCCTGDGAMETSAGGSALVDLARTMFASAWAGQSLLSRSAAEDARALRGIEAAGARLAQHRSSGTGPDTAIVSDYLGDSLIWAGADPAEGVLLTSASRARPRRRRFVFVLGLVEREFPEAEGGTGLLPSRFRRDCNRCAGAGLLGEPLEGQEAFLFRLACAAAEDVVYLSQRLADDDGGPLVESPFLGTLRREGRSLPVWRTRTLADVVHEAERAPSPREFLRSCAAERLIPEGVPGEGLRLVEPVARAGPVHLSDPSCLRRLREATSHTAVEIESYARCPVAWFLERVVGVEMPTEEGDPRVLGSVTHQVLASVYGTMMREGLVPLEARGLVRANTLVEGALEAVLGHLRGRRSSAALSLLAAQVRYRVNGFLSREAEQNRRLAPVSLEYSLPSAGVDLADGLVVRGRIDRVDEDADGTFCVVIDYKTGSFRPPRDWPVAGILQVPLYMLALERLHPEKRVVGGGYEILGAGAGEGLLEEGARDLAGDGDGWRVVSRDELDAVLGRCRTVAEDAVQGMRSGRFAYPAGGKCPGFCRLNAVCHRPGSGSGA